MNFVYEEYGTQVYRNIKKTERAEYSFRCLEELFMYLGHKNADKEILSGYFTYKFYSKNELVLNVDAVSDKIFFIANGAVRFFRKYQDRETTLLLLTEGNFVTSIMPFISASNSYSNAIATEDTFGVYIDRARYKALLQDVPGISVSFSVAMAKMLYFHQQLSEILRLDAATKFDFIQNRLPQVINRFQLNHQASFIGLKPETLSRVRNSFARKYSKSPRL
jgi:CRP-like cAMP-binding protein